MLNTLEIYKPNRVVNDKCVLKMLPRLTKRATMLGQASSPSSSMIESIFDGKIFFSYVFSTKHSITVRILGYEI